MFGGIFSKATDFVRSKAADTLRTISTPTELSGGDFGSLAFQTLVDQASSRLFNPTSSEQGAAQDSISPREVEVQSSENSLDNEQQEAPVTFENVVSRLLGKEGGTEVSEEQLYSAVVIERIASEKGAEAAQKFQDICVALKSELTSSDGYTPFETLTNQAINLFENQGGLTTSESARIKGEAFDASQLDENHTALYDHIGGAGDPTRAVMEASAAIVTAKAVIEKYSETGTT